MNATLDPFNKQHIANVRYKIIGMICFSLPSMIIQLCYLGVYLKSCVKYSMHKVKIGLYTFITEGHTMTAIIIIHTHTPANG